MELADTSNGELRTFLKNICPKMCNVYIQFMRYRVTSGGHTVCTFEK